ncbi:DUF2807 domain-containing protein [Xanthomonas sp. LMG 9002]|uniref:DUF2807 domain-containing protein n=1 Tax=Xanthomonas sp. LMG 9002 TaxID=1591158 RepID=UPI00136B6B41|nr:DUF2807 domain-containing protein [Xanthomonas sp. LMG 9002]MXV07651.1 hypothetical protein [Xanthomonas sp. LMG 9002]
MRKTLILCALLSLPAVAMADDCKYSEPRELKLDLAGVKTVLLDVQQNDLKLSGASAGDSTLRGRACASDADMLKELTLRQRHDGDTLVVTLKHEGKIHGISVGNRYAYLNVAGSIPANLPVQLQLGSGDAEISGVASLDAKIGSGDLHAQGLRGAVSATVGSGDIELRKVGSVALPTLGSGDVKADQVGGDVKVGTVGSGDLTVHGVRGSVQVDSLGSGDVQLRDVGGSVAVQTVGSGDLDVGNVGGNLSVQKVGSGDVTHRGVRGSVNLPKPR